MGLREQTPGQPINEKLRSTSVLSTAQEQKDLQRTPGLFKICLFAVYPYEKASMHVHEMHAVPMEEKESIRSLELGLQATMNYPVRVLETKPGSSARVASALNH